MLVKPIITKYSKNKKYRYAIYDKSVEENPKYEVWMQEIVTGENMGERWIQYCDIKNYVYSTNNLETAVKLADDELEYLK